ncbi:MAG: hypothetical protein HYW25_05920 [Candidatus Aenigmarchaeota archaeon]|nr:hypothetical protein [Candidatus Aenigmarchaeota archaeon]
MEHYRHVDSLLRQGSLSPLGIARECERIGEGPKTRQGVWKYIRRTGQQERYSKARNAYLSNRRKAGEELQEEQRCILNLLRNRLYELAEREGWEYGKAIEYDQGRPEKASDHNGYIPVENLIKLFREVRITRERGAKTTLRDLSRKSGIGYHATVRDIILKEGGEDILSWRWESLPDDARRMLRRAYQTDLSPADVSHFTGLPEKKIGYFFAKLNRETGRARKRKPVVQLRPQSSGIIILTRRDASQIYDGMDMGLSEEEVSGLLAKDLEAVHFAVENRKSGMKLEKTLVDSLKAIFDDPGISKPYMEIYRELSVA